MTSEYWLFAFDSPHAGHCGAAAAQGLRRGGNTETLRSITASCGMSLRLKDEAIERAKKIMLASSLDPAVYRLYRVEQEKETRCTQTPI